MPYGVRVQLGHAAVQHVAGAVGARVLHVKGFAVDPSLRRPGRQGTDVDVLVHPHDVDAVLSALDWAGWAHVTGFETGSAFGHATTLHHRHYGYADVHRFYPGLGDDPTASFELLWAERGEARIGGLACPVPSLPAQVLTLLLNAGRALPGDPAKQDIAHVWDAAEEQRRSEVRDLVARLGVGIGFAAAVGDLEDYRDRPDYGLWRVSGYGGTRLDEWRARVRAAATPRAKLALVLKAPLVNVDHLAAILGRRPTPLEVVREFFARPARGVREEWRRWRP